MSFAEPGSGPNAVPNNGQDTRPIQHYLGHRNVQHTVRYTALAEERFKGCWKD